MSFLALTNHPFDILSDCLKTGTTALPFTPENSDAIDWATVCQYSDTQGCNSLLYYRLKEHNLLSQLPKELEANLKQSFFGDSARALRYIHFLKQLLAEFNRQGIQTILLKGAATFIDQLYENSGLRPMGDLDILIEVNRLSDAHQILLSQGFIELFEMDDVMDNSAVDERHHQLPALHHPQLDILIELHFAVSYGQSGRILTAKHAWSVKQDIFWEGLNTAILPPTERVLHNIVHALKKDYLSASINFRQVVEFAYLVERYQKEVDWPKIIRLCEQESYTTPLFSYCLLAHQLLSLPIPKQMLGGHLAQLHAARLYAGLKDSAADKTGESFTDKLIRKLLLVYYRLALPSWAWSNVCYAPGWRNFPVRVGCMAGRIQKGVKALIDPKYDPGESRKS
jgi:hypothetical protein